MGSNPTFRTKTPERSFALSERSEPKGNPVLFPPGWYCYLLLCSDDSYYCGLTSNLNSRLRHHASGKGSGYTKATKPIALVWHERHGHRASAAARERQLKKWSHAKKRALASGSENGFAFGNRVWVSLGSALRSRSGQARDKLIPPSVRQTRQGDLVR
ncbi:MAG: GIY-YIG nuclease family protein [Acidobacteria bacterium]|nr:GIY-YIG nuclease family protein [Acidobacteriota bacterium]